MFYYNMVSFNIIFQKKNGFDNTNFFFLHWLFFLIESVYTMKCVNKGERDEVLAMADDHCFGISSWFNQAKSP